MSDADVLKRSVQDAPYTAKQVLASRFKAPSQVEFSDRQLLAKRDVFALVSAVADAPNAFGVKLRSKWCYIVEFKPPRGDRFVWKSEIGVWECPGEIDQSDLLVRQAAVGWPGAEEALLAESKARPTR